MGELKFPLVTKIVKANFSFMHDIADVEKRFSDSGNQLSLNINKDTRWQNDN